MKSAFVCSFLLAVSLSHGLADSVDVIAAATSKQKAGAFTLSNLQGEQVRLDDIKAKVIIIDFWQIWCKECKDAFPALNTLQRKYGPQELQVIGINLDKQSPQDISAFVTTAQIEYTVLLDPNGETVRTYDLKGVPTLILVDQKRHIAGRYRGYSEGEGKQIEAAVERLLE